jgi:hypothetical protein
VSGGRGHCATCEHPEREAIERALIAGTPLRELSRRYGMHRNSLSAHAHNHLGPAIQTAKKEREQAGPRSVLVRLEKLAQTVEAALYGADTLPVPLVRELRATLEVVGRITGELRDQPQLNLVLTQSPAWEQFAGFLLAVLEEHAPPELYRRVLAEVEKLPELEAATDGGDAA